MLFSLKPRQNTILDLNMRRLQVSSPDRDDDTVEEESTVHFGFRDSKSVKSDTSANTSTELQSSDVNDNDQVEKSSSND